MTREDTLNYLYRISNKTEKDLFKTEYERNPRIGLSFPQLKEISLMIFKNDPYQFLNSKRIDIYEIQIIETYLIGKIKDIDQALMYFDQAAHYAKDWSVVDSLCQKFVICKKYPDQTLDLLGLYSKENDEFYNRIVAVVLLSHFFRDETINQALDLLQALKHSGYYSQMAIAWAYATMMVKYPHLVINILESNKLNPWTHNKTIQKAIESFRIKPDTKAYIKQLKVSIPKS